MKKVEFGGHFRHVCLVLLFLVFVCSETCATESYSVSKKGNPGDGSSKADRLAVWIPLPRKSQTQLSHTKAFKATFVLPFERVPKCDLKRSWEFGRWMEKVNSIHPDKPHHDTGTGKKIHMGRMNKIGKMDHSVRMANKPGGMQNHGLQTGGLGESMKNSLQPSNREDGQHSGKHGGDSESRYLAKIQQLTTLQFYPGMAMGVSLAGHGPEMWAQCQVRSDACLTFNLQHEQQDAQARLGLDMDL